jgi:hypothetical protein
MSKNKLKTVSFAAAIRLALSLPLTLGLPLAFAAEKSETQISKELLSFTAKLGKKAYGSNLAYDIDESLTTEVGPRRVGTPGDSAGVKWATSKMMAFGFDKVWTEKIVTPGWDRGEITAKVIAPYPQRMVAIALGSSVSTPKGGITAPVVHFKTMAELKAAPKGSLKGKIAFISLRMERTIDGSGYGPGGAPRRQGGKIASDLGALALIIRSVGTDNDRIAHTGGQSSDIPAAALSNPDADILVNMFKRTNNIKFHLDISAKPTEDVVTYNVIGEITGSEQPDKYVVLGAHLDSWDVGTGAVDDGMGVGITMAAAKHIIDSGKKPKRSIRVLLFGAEEIGLYGVKEYAKIHAADIKNHIIGAEWDSGTGKIYALRPGVGTKALGTIRIMAKLIAPYGVSLHPSNNAKGQSDMSVLGKLGMPAINFSADSTTYFDYHHTENDTMSVIDPEVMRQASAIYTIYAWMAANSGTDFRK